MKFYIRELNKHKHGQLWKERWCGHSPHRSEAYAYSREEILKDHIIRRRLKEGTLRLVYAYE